MGRWWKQVCSLPDIKLLATMLNGLVPADSNKDFELKKSVLRYCMLSYTLLMNGVSEPSKKRPHYVRRFGKTKEPLHLSLVHYKNLLLPGTEEATKHCLTMN